MAGANGENSLQTLQWWSCRKEVVPLVLGYLTAYQARPEVGAPGVAFIYVQQLLLEMTYNFSRLTFV